MSVRSGHQRDSSILADPSWETRHHFSGPAPLQMVLSSRGSEGKRTIVEQPRARGRSRSRGPSERQREDAPVRQPRSRGGSRVPSVHHSDNGDDSRSGSVRSRHIPLDMSIFPPVPNYDGHPELPWGEPDPSTRKPIAGRVENGEWQDADPELPLPYGSCCPLFMLVIRESSCCPFFKEKREATLRRSKPDDGWCKWRCKKLWWKCKTEPGRCKKGKGQTVKEV